MNKFKFSFLALFLISANLLSAQIVSKVPAEPDSMTVILPIGESLDTAWILGVLAQEKEPLKAERFIAVTRTYVFQNPKLNKPIEQWFERIPSAMNPNASSKRIPDFKKNLVWYTILENPK